MKKIFVLTCFLFISLTSSYAVEPTPLLGMASTNEKNYGIHFTFDSWAGLVKKAKAENKLIFVDFYTQWCGPCYHMATKVFSMPQVGDFYNRHFICAKIDAEVGEGYELAKKYHVRSYPTYGFIDPDTGAMVHRSGSRQTAEQFLNTGKSALVPCQRSTFLNEAYEKGLREKKFLVDFITYKHSVYDQNSVNEAFDALIKGGATLKEAPIWQLFVETISSLSPYLLEVSDHYDEYCQLYGKQTVDAKLAKETQYGDLKKIEGLCDFEGKAFNCEMIRINEVLYRRHDYEEAIRRIDSLIGNPHVDQQKLIDRLKFIARVRTNSYSEVPQRWFYKCVEYLRYVAYNNADRDDAGIHQAYAEALEMLVRQKGGGKEVPACLVDTPCYGRTEYSLRPDALKMKPQYKKRRIK